MVRLAVLLACAVTCACHRAADVPDDPALASLRAAWNLGDSPPSLRCRYWQTEEQPPLVRRAEDFTDHRQPRWGVSSCLHIGMVNQLSERWNVSMSGAASWATFPSDFEVSNGEAADVLKLSTGVSMHGWATIWEDADGIEIRDDQTFRQAWRFMIGAPPTRVNEFRARLGVHDLRQDDHQNGLFIEASMGSGGHYACGSCACGLCTKIESTVPVKREEWAIGSVDWDGELACCSINDVPIACINTNIPHVPLLAIASIEKRSGFINRWLKLDSMELETGVGEPNGLPEQP